MLADIKASRVYDTTTLPVALREVRSLIRVAGAQAEVGAAGTNGADPTQAVVDAGRRLD